MFGIWMIVPQRAGSVWRFLTRDRSHRRLERGELDWGRAVKHGIPQVLLIGGHNPLTLLHNALSEGLHARDDAECLELATSIRVVLSEFVERVAVALKDEATLLAAVGRLMSVRAPTAASAEGSAGGNTEAK